MDLASLLLERFKCATRAVENPIATSVGATAAVILSNNPNRLAWVIINLSVNAIYLGLTNGVSATNGIYLGANGGSVTMTWDEDFQLVGWAIWAIAPAGASACYSIEVVTQ